MRKLTLPNLIFGLILLAYVGYALRFIYLTSFVIHGERYFALFDDAMISLRYAKNLAAGHGLVWNPGERVEGFTNPGWVVFMGLFHLLPIPASKISLFIQVSGLVILAANLFFVRKIARHLAGNEWVALGAVFLTAFFFSLNNWTLQGMEVGALALLTSLAAWLALRQAESGRFNLWLYVLLAAGTLIRMDMAVPALVVTGFAALTDRPNRRKHLVWGLGLLFAFLLGQTLLRRWYYGEWLPNTYYLKLGGLSLLSRVRRGFGVFWQLVWNTGWLLFAVPLLAFALEPTRATLLLFALFAGQVAYSIYVGGDAWEHRGGANRFIAIAMPQFFVVFCYALELARRTLLGAVPKWPVLAGYASRAGVLAFLVLSLFSFNTILTNDPTSKWLLTKRPIFVLGTERVVEIGLAVEKITTPEARIAVVSAGAIPYFSGRYSIDLLGKIDKVIAHTPPRLPKGLTEYADFQPGHVKWDYAYSIGELKPDVIPQFVDETLDEARAYLDADYTLAVVEGFPFYLRTDSPNILWDKITP